MMRAIFLIIGLTISFITGPAAKPARVGVLMSGSPATHGHNVDWLREGLAGLGNVEGRNFVFVHRWAMAKRKRLPALARELVAAKVDVIVVNGGTSIKAALKATRKIPIDVGSSGNLAQHVVSLARPGGNITGLTFERSALNGKRLGLLMEAFPGARRMAFVHSPLKRALRDLKRLRVAGKALGFTVQPFRVRTIAEIEAAFVSMAEQRADALIINLSSVTNFHRKRLAALAIKNKLPSMCEQVQFARAGCLMAYAPDREHMLHRAAAYVDRILKGASPAELPVEIASRYKLVVNLKTARTLGIKLPPTILLQADEVIE